ncbi:MAG TPA: hypothetical protein VNI58_05110 [Mariprofundaceae bacterium]|nr:hypothetical protein [Mariprofundaceae bacterium]
MADVVPVLITGVITIFGWYATYAYAKLREDRTRRLDLFLQLRARQIEELYGPLLSLIEQVFNVWQVRENVLRGTSCSEEDQRKIREFFWLNYFTPLHQDIGKLLRTKLYLLEGGILPESFNQYLEHATQEECQHRLWSELGIDTSKVQGRRWPQEFHRDVKDTLDRLMQDYQSGMTRLA